MDWLFIIFSVILSLLQCCSAKYFVAAPNLIRIGVDETVSIFVDDTNSQVKVKVSLQDYPSKTKTFSQVECDVTSLHPANVKMKVNAADLASQKSVGKKYVFLTVVSITPGFQFNNEMKIRLGSQNAMVLIQTDKPVYNPGQIVHFRVIPLDLSLLASLKKVTIEVLNPQGIRVQRWKDLNTDDGFFPLKEALSKNALLGNWTVLALYGYGLSQNSSVKFEVKEYTLPKFSVKIKGPDYICEDDEMFSIRVESTYTYGKGVQGTAHISMAVPGDRGKEEKFSVSMHLLKRGEATQILSTKLIKNHRNIWFPDGKRLSIKVKVIEDVTGNYEEVTDNTILFTKSPLRISFKRTSLFFKPGLPFKIKVDVIYVNGKPAKDIAISLTAHTNSGVALHEETSGMNKDKTDHSGYGSFAINIPSDHSINHLNIKVEAQLRKYGKVITTQNSFQPTMYQSPGHNYLLVKFRNSLQRVPKAGHWVYVEATVVSKGNPQIVSYMVVARGNIVTQGAVSTSALLNTISVKIKPEMSPMARIIAYYKVNNEIVADSITMEVEPTYPNKVKFKSPESFTMEPGDKSQIKIETTPYSHVGILAVDESVYLVRNDKQLTHDTVFRRLRSHDLGCGAGGGHDSKDVFSRAGLAAMTDTNNLKTNPQTDQKCAGFSRRRRRSTDKACQIRCCLIGKKADPRSCLVRGKEMFHNISLSSQCRKTCAEELYICCRKTFENDFMRRRFGGFDFREEFYSGMSADDEGENVKDQLRNDFPEIWFDEDHFAGKDGKVTIPVSVPHSITTWVLQAISVSNQTGFGLANPVYIKSFKEFFVSLDMPYTAQRGEQISLVATVFNYGNRKLQVELLLEAPGNSEFCSFVEPGNTRPIYKLTIDKNSAESVSFPIVPTQIGDIPILVYATVVGGSTDAEQRVLKVVPEGMQRSQTHSIVIDPKDMLRDPSSPTPATTKSSKIFSAVAKENGIQRNRVNLTLPKTAVKDSKSASLFVIGNLLGKPVSDVINGKQLGSIIKLPTGCGEQNMLKLAPNVFVLQYLRSTKQVTPDIENTAFSFIRSGYQNELDYRRDDNSFSAFGNGWPASTWLTSFVIKTFCAIQKLSGVDIDENVICKAINWLSSIQRQDGAIPEYNPVLDRAMTGDINGDIAMTAYVITALLECNCPTVSTLDTLPKAVKYLENNRHNINRVYVKAVVAYALALAFSPQMHAANNDLLQQDNYDAAKNTRYWADGGKASTVETTSYVLLTQMAMGRVQYSGPIVVWLTQQRNGGGGFVSTQDTCVALQALAAYSQATDGNAVDLEISVTSEDFQYKETFFIDKLNALVQQHKDLSKFMDGEFYIEAKGTGVAQLQIETTYNTPVNENDICQFHLSVKTLERFEQEINVPKIVGKRAKRSTSNERKGRKGRKNGRKNQRKNRKRRRRKNRRREQRKKPVSKKRVARDQPAPNRISLEICARSRKTGGNGMSILDIGILTGFNFTDIGKLKRNGKLGVAKVELSHRHFVLYLDKIPSNETLCFSLKMKRNFEVGEVQPVPVLIYDYYEPDIKCTKYYGPKSTSQLTVATCEKENCKCAVDKCTLSRKSDNGVMAVRRMCFAYDFACIVKIRLIAEGTAKLKLISDVEEVWKRGKQTLVKGQKLFILRKASCKYPVSTERGTYLLIMGKNAELRVDLFNSNSIEFNLNSNAYAKALPKHWARSKFYRDYKRIMKVNSCT